MQCTRHICSQAYINNMKYMYANVHGHSDVCTEFICGIYANIVVFYVNMNLAAYILYIYIYMCVCVCVAFEEHFCCWHMHGNNL